MSTSKVGACEKEAPHDIDRWLKDVEALCRSIRNGLAPLVAAKLATVVTRTFSITEAARGAYSIAGLEITVAVGCESRLILVRPRGMSILGAVETGVAWALNASGRVDLESDVARTILLRFADRQPVRWVSFSTGARKALDDRVFVKLLMELVEHRLT